MLIVPHCTTPNYGMLTLQLSIEAQFPFLRGLQPRLLNLVWEPLALYDQE